MRLNKNIIILIAMLVINDTLSAQVKSNSFKVLLKTMLSSDIPKITVPAAAGSSNSFLFLDAGEPEEYNVSHIKNARFVGYKKFDLSTVNSMDKKTPLIVYCAIGKRSDEITKKLKEAGFVNVVNLYGGIFEWVNQGHPVYNNQNVLTDSVHAYGRFWGQWLDKGKKVY